MHEDNVIYIFCDDKFNGKEHTFKINGEQKTIKSGTYYKCIIKENSEVVINKGGVTGGTLKVKWEIGNPARFISITGFTFMDIPRPSNAIGVGFSTGKIYQMTANFGLLLTQTLKIYE